MILIVAKKAAGASSKINIAEIISKTDARYALNSTFRLTGGTLSTDEYVQLQYHDGTTWRTANIDGNDGKILDEDTTVCTVYGNMKNMRLYKSITAATIGVEVV